MSSDAGAGQPGALHPEGNSDTAPRHLAIDTAAERASKESNSVHGTLQAAPASVRSHVLWHPSHARSLSILALRPLAHCTRAGQRRRRLLWFTDDYLPACIADVIGVLGC